MPRNVCLKCKENSDREKATFYEILLHKPQEDDPEENWDSGDKIINNIGLRRSYRKKHKSLVAFKKPDTSTNDANRINSLVMDTVSVFVLFV